MIFDAVPPSAGPSSPQTYAATIVLGTAARPVIDGISKEITKLNDAFGLSKTVATQTRAGITNIADSLRNSGRLSRNRPACIAELTTSRGKVINGISDKGRGGGQPNGLTPNVQRALDKTSIAGSSGQRGNCAELHACSKAERAGHTLRGSKIRTAEVKGPNSTNPVHGQPKDPCEFCGPALKELGVIYDAAPSR